MSDLKKVTIVSGETGLNLTHWNLKPFFKKNCHVVKAARDWTIRAACVAGQGIQNTLQMYLLFVVHRAQGMVAVPYEHCCPTAHNFLCRSDETCV